MVMTVLRTDSRSRGADRNLQVQREMPATSTTSPAKIQVSAGARVVEIHARAVNAQPRSAGSPSLNPRNPAPQPARRPNTAAVSVDRIRVDRHGEDHSVTRV
jgi:hypothetical protein